MKTIKKVFLFLESYYELEELKEYKIGFDNDGISVRRCHSDDSKFSRVVNFIVLDEETHNKEAPEAYCFTNCLDKVYSIFKYCLEQNIPVEIDITGNELRINNIYMEGNKKLEHGIKELYKDSTKLKPLFTITKEEFDKQFKDLLIFSNATDWKDRNLSGSILMFSETKIEKATLSPAAKIIEPFIEDIDRNVLRHNFQHQTGLLILNKLITNIVSNVFEGKFNFIEYFTSAVVVSEDRKPYTNKYTFYSPDTLLSFTALHREKSVEIFNKLKLFLAEDPLKTVYINKKDIFPLLGEIYYFKLFNCNKLLFVFDNENLSVQIEEKEILNLKYEGNKEKIEFFLIIYNLYYYMKNIKEDDALITLSLRKKVENNEERDYVTFSNNINEMTLTTYN
jgi:hypothetical protein